MELKSASRIVVGQHEGLILTDSSGRNRSIDDTQTREHLGLFATCHQPDDAPRPIEHAIGQGHPVLAICCSVVAYPRLAESRSVDSTGIA